jgi:hypothetical protein
MAISFDGAERLITLTTGTVELDVHDLYSRWKDWNKTGDNAKYAIAFQTTGGDDIDEGAGTKIPLYAFLVNGWRIRPQEASHTLNVTAGILLVDGGGDPFVDTLGSYIVRINYQQPVQAIKVESGVSGLTPTESAQLGVIQEVEDKVDIVDTNVDTVLVNLANLDSDVAAVQADTDNIQTRIPAALVDGKMDSTLSSTEREAIANMIFDLAAGVEAGLTMRQALRIAIAVLAGKSSGWPAGGASEIFRDTNDTKDRVTATVDADGNRTAVTLDPS